MNELIAGSGGGGCFRKGTLVQLQHGKAIAIEDLQVGDKVLAFDDTGSIHESEVKKVHIHTDPQPILKVKFWSGEIFITPNHWVLNQYSSFVEVGSLTIEDALVDGMGHLRPIISMEIIGYEPVYNLTVDIHHTFIANNIRVHNGGHRDTYPVITGAGGGGGKGGGGGSARTAVEAPNNLKSIQYAEVIDVISEGEIEGLATSRLISNTGTVSNISGSGSGSIKLINVTPNPNVAIGRTVKVNGMEAVIGEVSGTTVTINSISSINSIQLYSSVNIEVYHSYVIRFNRFLGNKGGSQTIYSTDYTFSAVVNDLYCTGPWYANLSGLTTTYGISVGDTFVASSGTGSIPNTLCFITGIVSETSISFYVNGATRPYVGTIANIKTSGAASIFLDDVPIIEFSDYAYEFRTGTQTQSVTNVGLQGSKTTTEVGLLVRKTLDSGGSGDVTKSIEVAHYYAGLKSIDITIGIPALTHQDISNGDLNGTSVGFILQLGYTNNGNIIYNDVHNTSISGKCTSMYNKSYNIAVDNYPATSYPLYIRMIRTTEDSSSSSLQNKIYFGSYTLNYPTKLNYPNTALVSLKIDSDQFTSIPIRSYEIKGVKIKVPSNYNSDTRQYSGFWDGTFKIAWTDNPAWIYYDLLTDSRYGIGEYITEDRVDKWALYTIAKYCDELIPDGLGSTEPRFTCNMYIQTQGEAYRVLSDLCSIFRGMQYWAGGMFNISVDMPKDAVHSFTSSNVIDGIFNYSGSSLKTRHTAVKVIWNDPTDAYKQKVEYVEANGFSDDYNPINVFGTVQTDIVAIGCTSRGQANRVGRWLLYTELYETETITFKTGIENAVLLPGSIIEVADPFRQGTRMGGRVKSVISSTKILLDVLEGTLTDGDYKISFLTPSVDPETNIAKSGLTVITGEISEGNIFTASSDAFSTVLENSIWVASSNTIEPEQWRVISISQDDEVTATIVALEYNKSKFDAIEKELVLETRPTSQIDYGKPSTPVMATDEAIITKVELFTTLSVALDEYSNTIYCQSTNGFSNSGLIQVDNELMYYSSKTEFAFNNVLRAYTGLDSTSSLHVLNSRVDQVTIKYNTQSWVKEYLFYQAPGVLGNAAVISWTGSYLRYEVRYKNKDTTVWTQETSYGPSIELKPIKPGIYDIEIRAVNTIGRRSDPIIKTMTLLGESALPLNVTTFTSIKSPSGIVLTWDANDLSSDVRPYPDLDLFGYEIREAYYTNLPSTLQYDSFGQINWSSNTTLLEKEAEWNAAELTMSGLVSSTTYTDVSAKANRYNVFFIKAVDRSGKYSEVASTCGVKINPPQSITSSTIGINGTDLLIQWSPSISDVGISHYSISYADGSTTKELICNIPEFRQRLWFTGYKLFNITAYDISGNSSPTVSLELTINQIHSVVNLENNISGENYVLKWESPPIEVNTPIVDSFELRLDLNWGSTTNLIATTKSSGFSAKVDWVGDRVLYIAAKDSTGNYGVATSITIVSEAPSAVNNFLPSVIDNNVLFTWTPPSTGIVLPIIAYELRKGVTWDTGTNIGTKQGLFTSIFESTSGTYTYWIAAINSAGATGTPVSVSTIVNQPPDYVLVDDYYTDFINAYGTNGSVTKYNAHIGMDNNLILPINTTQSWADHFTSSGYDQIQDFLNAGFDNFIEPTPSIGYYEEVMDFGLNIVGSKVALTPTILNVSGNPIVTYEVSTSQDNITYSTPSIQLVNYLTQFRYLKVRLSVTGGIIKLSSLNTVIDVKQKTHAGSLICNSSDTSGTTVYITNDGTSTGTKLFSDIRAINLTANTISGKIPVAIYDFVDVPDPLSFKILLFDSTTGTRVSGSCSYSIRGV